MGNRLKRIGVPKHAMPALILLTRMTTTHLLARMLMTYNTKTIQTKIAVGYHRRRSKNVANIYGRMNRYLFIVPTLAANAAAVSSGSSSNNPNR